jgi:cytochrome P450
MPLMTQAPLSRERRPLGRRFADDEERYAHYARQRAQSPVWRDEETGSWHVYRYADVQQVLTNHQAFASHRAFGQGDRGGGASDPPPPQRPGPMLLAESLISSDPPRHTQLRALVNKAFTPRAVAALEPSIRALAREMLDRLAPTGRMDVMADLARPLPVTVIAQLLGIAVEDRAQFQKWSDDLVGSSDAAAEGDPEVRRRAQQALADYFRAVVADKRRRPGDDLISALLAARIDGEALQERELLAFCTLLLIAGHETTTNLIGNGFLCLLQHPEAHARLRADPALAASAVEEVLRFSSPVQALVRRTVKPLRLGGASLPADATVVPWIGSANRDEAVFPEPERFLLTRSPNRHLAFGAGIHFCLGAPLARLEGRLVLQAMVERLRDPELDAQGPLRWSPGFLRGLRRLPVRFRATA